MRVDTAEVADDDALTCHHRRGAIPMDQIALFAPIVLALTGAVVCAVLAQSRGRSVLAWTGLGFLFSVLAIAGLLWLPNAAEAA